MQNVVEAGAESLISPVSVLAKDEDEHHYISLTTSKYPSELFQLIDYKGHESQFTKLF